MMRVIALGLLGTAGFVFFGFRSEAEVYVGQRGPATITLQQIDHSAWDQLLRKYVNDDGMVNYQAWHRSSADRRRVSDYLGHLSTAEIDSNAPRDASLAFWINAYNALTVHGILREYPTSSIRNHTPRVVGYNIWKHLQLYVGGEPYSLNDIEHDLLRKMGEPQIHFAIVCASVGCPRLLNNAYLPERVQEQLDQNSLDFFNRPQNFQYRDGTLYLSSILYWFGKDFGSSQSQQLKKISEWLPTADARNAANSGDANVEYLDYDWNLNEQ